MRTISAIVIAATLSVSAALAEIRFNRDIRPILSENCFACHGPDEHDRKAGLRLDTREGATADNDGVRAIVPGDLDASELVYRLITEDKEELMPPPESEKTLSAEQIALLKQWVAEGAKYEGHWSYEHPIKAEVPAGAHPIDHFVDAKLAEAKTEPAPAAAPHELVRRLHFDLTGLPPTPAEVASFTTVAARTKELLASPRYGERMATYWLDLVRYADSIGYHSDNPMGVAPYREWVIKAFNGNQPYDEFTRWQLAGDLLPDATTEQKIASGYNRLLQTTQEGGAQAKEYLAIYAADRVRNVSGVWLGGTLGCAQCHDHKYDPYTARDFYSMAAFFADVTERGVGARQNAIPVPTQDQQAQLGSLNEQVAALDKKTKTMTPEVAAAQAAWEKSIGSAALPTFSEWQLIGPFAAKDGQTAHKEDKITKANIGPKAQIDGKKWQRKAEFENGKPHALGSTANSAQYLFRTVDVPADGELELSLGSDDAIKFWVDGELKIDKYITRSAAPDQEKLTLNLKKGVHQLLLKITNVGGGSAFYFNVRGLEVPAEVGAALKIAADKRDDKQRKTISDFYIKDAPLLADARNQLAKVTKARDELNKTIPTTLITVAMAKPRTTRILNRGDWQDDDGEIVGPAVPTFLGEVTAEGERPTRLDLANWMVGPQNPTTSRTFVNRLWKLFYGAALSRNPDDLGNQGRWPTHPELLDWLAVEFVESGWDVKHMVELMVTSDAYARSSKAAPEMRSKDPANEMLARQSRHRLDAEMVRDNALAVSGLLVEKVGGESVKPYQPAGYWQHLNFPARKWAHDAGDKQYRRAMYTHWQRSFLHPAMVAFDAPTREECTAERPRSNTPLQALVLLNDPTYVEAARAFAERILAEGGGDLSSQIRWAYQTALSRPPSPEELALVSELHTEQLARYAADNEAAAQLLTVGAHKPPATTPELAAATAVARTILNLHETITRP